jgi:hypothetical protein
MTDVSEWARREAVNPHMPPPNPEWQGGAVWVAERMAALLLSDEVVEAAAQAQSAKAVDGLWADQSEGRRIACRRDARAALTAALTKITEDKE